MKRKFFYCCLIVLTTLIACKKNWLDEKTNQSLAVPSTIGDFQALLDNSGVMNSNSPAIQELASDGHGLLDSYFSLISAAYYANPYIWSHQNKYIGVTDWNSPYQRVAYCNIVLDGVEKFIPESTADQVSINNIKGQALFQRARTFFELAQLYAPQFNPATAANDLSINLRLTADVNIKTTRSNVEETYSQIVNDLLQAKKLLPVIPLYKSRASKGAAYALLARVYLDMNDYANAALYADSSLQLNSTLIDYNSISASPSYPFSIFNNEVLFHSTLANYGFIKNLLIDTALYNSYSINDLRYTLYYKKNSDGTVNYRGSYANSVLLFGGLAVDEMYLISAECAARSGNTTKAMNDLNTLLKTRWKTGMYVQLSATSSSDALRQILVERKKELICRGIRWSDLRRLNLDPSQAITLSRNVLGTSYTLEPNSFKYVFPIPDDIIQISGIQQNAGW